MRFFMTSNDIGIDLGTSNTLLFVKGKGIVLKEPSVVALNTKTRNVLAVGSNAKSMIGRTPENIITLNPLKDGVIANFDITQQMLKKFIQKASGKNTFKNSRIIICHPSGITEVEKRAIKEATSEIGARKVVLIEGAVAAAIGAGLPVNEPMGSMIIDIGGGTTEVAVISLGGIVTSNTVKIAGDELNQNIIDYVKKEFSLLIGEITAEEIKMELGSAYQNEAEVNKEMDIRGRDLVTGLPKEITITESQVYDALKEPISFVVEAIKNTLEHTAPELAADIMDKGIMLTGGGVLLKGLDMLISEKIHIPAHLAEYPQECVAHGAGKCLEMIDVL